MVSGVFYSTSHQSSLPPRQGPCREQNLRGATGSQVSICSKVKKNKKREDPGPGIGECRILPAGESGKCRKIRQVGVSFRRGSCCGTVRRPCHNKPDRQNEEARVTRRPGRSRPGDCATRCGCGWRRCR